MKNVTLILGCLTILIPLFKVLTDYQHGWLVNQVVGILGCFFILLSIYFLIDERLEKK